MSIFMMRLITNSIKKNKYPIVTSSFLYIIGILAGIAVFLNDSTLQTSNIMAEQSMNTSSDLSISYFLKTNGSGIAILILGGALLGAPTLVSLITNGYVHSRVILAISLSPIEFIILFVPHAIFEIPAIILAGSVGIKPPISLYEYFTHSSDFITKDYLSDIIILSALAFILIVIAAFVESMITPLFWEYYT